MIDQRTLKRFFPYPCTLDITKLDEVNPEEICQGLRYQMSSAADKAKYHIRELSMCLDSMRVCHMGVDRFPYEGLTRRDIADLIELAKDQLTYWTVLSKRFPIDWLKYEEEEYGGYFDCIDDEDDDE